MIAALLLMALACLTSSIQAAVPADLIDSLPGFGATPSPQYSGLLPVDAAKSAYLHYWLVLAENVPSKSAPLVIWLNGGPGCSSLDGFLYEHGPFRFTGDVDSATGVPKLRKNDYAWSTVSNMLYIESPFGVGYSYAVNGSLTSNDDTTSQNLYGFLLNFFVAYPELSLNSLFVTGESYAGFYVPQLSLRIHEGNAKGNPYMPLVGLAVGNACVGEGGSCGADTRKYDQTEFYYGHSMISQDLYETVVAACGPTINSTSEACSSAYSAATGRRVIGNIWVYDVYDICGNEVVSPGHKTPVSPRRLMKHPESMNLESHMRGMVVDENGHPIMDPIQCEALDSTLGDKFMNSDLVKKALHIDQVKVAAPWSVCANVDYTRSTVTLLPLYQNVLLDNYRVLVFGGDADACVVWNGSERWTRSLGRAVKTPWRPYLINDHYIGGFLVEYDTKPGFVFASAKHAGHMVPQYEEEIGFALFAMFLNGRYNL